MRPGELETVIRLWHETCDATYGFIPIERGRTFAERRGFFLENVAPKCRLFVAVRDGAIVGFLALRGSYLDRLYVHPEAQRAGAGSALLEEAKRQCPDGFELHTHRKNVRACAFYERHGLLAFRFGVSPPPESEPDVEYRWRPE